MPSAGRKYVTSWEREQDRIAALSEYSVSSLDAETFVNDAGEQLEPLDLRHAREEDDVQGEVPEALDLRKHPE